MANMNWNWNQYSYKNLDEKRRDAEKSKLQSKFGSTRRIGAAIVAAVVVLLGNIPSEISDSFAEVLPVIGLILAIAFPFILGGVIVMLARRKFRRENLYAEELPSSYELRENQPQAAERYYAPQDARPQQSGERYTVYTSSSRDFPNAVDSWDIKDPKPPWEL